MDNFYPLLALVVRSQGGDPSKWSEEYQDCVEALREHAYTYAQVRADASYEMGFAHGKGMTVQTLRTNKAINEAKVRQAQTEIVVNFDI